MSTATVTNEKPLTAELPFDLGDVLRCGRERPVCPNEAAWLLLFDCCDRPDSPTCEPCRKDCEYWRHVECKFCGAVKHPKPEDWRRL